MTCTQQSELLHANFMLRPTKEPDVYMGTLKNQNFGLRRILHSKGGLSASLITSRISGRGNVFGPVHPSVNTLTAEPFDIQTQK